MSKANQDRLLFLSFCIEQYKKAKDMTGEEVMRLFIRYGVLDYLAKSYEVLHTQGSTWLLAEIDEFIGNRQKEAIQ